MRNLNFLGSPSMSPEYRITLARSFAGEGTASAPGVRVHLPKGRDQKSFSVPPSLLREGGQGVRFQRSKRSCFFSSSITLRHPERSRRISAKRFSTIVFERRFLPRQLFYGRGGRVAERLGGEDSENSASQRPHLNLNFLGSPFLVREGGQGVRFPRAAKNSMVPADD